MRKRLDEAERGNARGALLEHITRSAESGIFQPMNVNSGLFPPLEKRRRGRERKKAYSERALADLDRWRLAAENAPA